MINTKNTRNSLLLGQLHSQRELKYLYKYLLLKALYIRYLVRTISVLSSELLYSRISLGKDGKEKHYRQRK